MSGGKITVLTKISEKPVVSTAGFFEKNVILLRKKTFS
jgi:hypothetical protein